MIHIGYSGGGLKGIGQLGIAEIISNKVKPDILSGISVGSIMAILHALILCKLITWKQVREVFFTMSPSTIFSVHPLTKKGLLRGILSFVIKNIHSLGKQDNLDDILKKVVTKQIFDKYKFYPNSPIVYVGYIDYKLGDIIVVNLKELEYESAIKAILASSHVPVATEAIKLFDTYAYDGGLVDHVISATVIEKYEDAITSNINIFSRPKDDYLNNNSWKPKNIANVLERTLEIGMSRISKDDEKLINAYCQLYDIKNYSIYLPTVLDNMYDFDKNRLNQLYHAGKKQGSDFINSSWQY